MTAENPTLARQGFGDTAVRRRRLAPSFVISILAHALLLALAILLAHRRIEPPEWLPPPTFEVVPDSGGASKPSVAAPEPQPTPATPPEAAPAPPPTPTPAAPSTPPPPAPAPAMPPTPSPPAAVPVEPLAPPPSAIVPAFPIMPPPPALAPEAIPLSPAPTEPPLPRPEIRVPLTIQPIVPMPPPVPRQTFPAPMAFSLGGPTAAPSPRRRAGRGIDLSLGSGVVGAADTRIFGRSDSKEVGPDWYNRFAAWWDRHGYYPPQAGRNGQQGDVVLDMVVLRSGQVERVALTSPSGSQWLDMAALGVFRDARLPPLPANTAASVPITLRIHYQILH